MQQTSFSQRDCARLLNSLKLFRLSKSKGGKKALSARELNSCTNLLLPRFPWAVCQREVLVHIFNGEGGRKKEISLSFHNLPNAVSSLLASEVLSFQTYMIMSRIIFLGFAIFQGRKLILSSRNEASGHLAISVLLPASYRNQKKKCFHATTHFIICSYLAGWIFLTVYFYSMRNHLPQKQYFPRKLPALLQFSIFFPSTLTCYETFALTDEGGIAGFSQGSGFSPGSQDMPSLPETGQAPSKLSPALVPSTAAARLFQSSTTQVAEKHLLISWLCLVVISL